MVSSQITTLLNENLSLPLQRRSAINDLVKGFAGSSLSKIVQVFLLCNVIYSSISYQLFPVVILICSIYLIENSSVKENKVIILERLKNGIYHVYQGAGIGSCLIIFMKNYIRSSHFIPNTGIVQMVNSPAMLLFLLLLFVVCFCQPYQSLPVKY